MYASEEIIKSYNQEQSPTVQVVHKQEIATFKIPNWQTCVCITMTLDMKTITGIRTICTGALKCSRY